jgi:hypothetical protein
MLVCIPVVVSNLQIFSCIHSGFRSFIYLMSNVSQNYYEKECFDDLIVGRNKNYYKKRLMPDALTFNV